MMAEAKPAATEPEPIRKNYRLLTGIDNVEFCERVSQARERGWELYGDPTMTFNGETVIVGQALVRAPEKRKVK